MPYYYTDITVKEMMNFLLHYLKINDEVVKTLEWELGHYETPFEWSKDNWLYCHSKVAKLCGVIFCLEMQDMIGYCDSGYIQRWIECYYGSHIYDRYIFSKDEQKFIDFVKIQSFMEED